MNIDFGVFEKKTNLKFSNKELLKRAFTHRSFINENKGQGEHNERLEFLGDAVLELVITDYLFHKYPDSTEGELTLYRAALVNTQSLSQVALDLSMNEYLLLSKGEAKDTGKAREHILANTVESLIGAIYLDSGYDDARDFIVTNISHYIDEIVEKGTWIDSKSKFQEKAQEATGITPMYKTVRETGPDHDKKFTVGVYLNNEKVAEGNGNSKQSAEQDAALNGLVRKGWD
ncbi:MAG: ribonuclease III [Candidatus Pacebacteria bacterium]|nr:ribonuclease III [Candidatus Paceibacterota bacterium]